MSIFIPSTPKKIVINATNIGNNLNGIGVYTLNLVRELADVKTDFQFIIYLNRSCKNHFTKINFPENFIVKWVSQWVSPDKNFIGHFLRLLYSNYLSFKHYRLLQINTSPLEICILKSNQIVTVHDIIPLLFKDYHKKQYWFYKILLKNILNKVVKILTPSVHTKNLLVKYYKLAEDKINVVYPGVCYPNTNKDLSAGIPSPYILYIGRINKMKNVDGIIKSFIIASRIVEINLVVIGNNIKEFNNILDMLKCNRETRSKIIFMKDVSEEQKIGLLKNASLFLYPTHYEGFGLPPLEAMKIGCPVIVSDNSCMPEICKNAAYYVNPADDNEIAYGILEILRNEKLRRYLVQNGFENSAGFSWQRMVSEQLKIIENVFLYPTKSAKSKVLPSNPIIRKKFILDKFFVEELNLISNESRITEIIKN